MVKKNIEHFHLLLNQELLKMVILSLVAMTGLEKCCTRFAYMQWLYFTQVSEPWLEAGDMCNSRILLVCVSRLHLIDLLAYF